MFGPMRLIPIFGEPISLELGLGFICELDCSKIG